MQPKRILVLLFAATLALLLSAGCSATESMGTLDKPAWDYLQTSAQTSGDAFNFDQFVPAADTLYAIPLQQRVKAGEPVRIVVVTGVPSGPISYMSGVAVS